VRCDNEFQEVAERLKKQVYINRVIIEHDHVIWNKGVQDDLYRSNSKYFREDNVIYKQRKEIGFPTAIPKIAYFLWSEGTPLSYLRYLTLWSFRRLHPEWEMKLYLAKSINTKNWKGTEDQDYLQAKKGKDYLEIVDKLNVSVTYWDKHSDMNPTQVADLFRFEMLADTGGWFFDLDQIFLNSFNDLIYEHEWVFGGRSVIYIGVMGAAPRSEICGYIYKKQLEFLSKGKPDKYCQIGNWLLMDLLKNDQNFKNILKRKRWLQTEDDDFYPILHSHLIKNVYEGKVDIETSSYRAYALHWYGGHPDSQKFNSEFTEETVKNGTDSISTYLRLIL
jgi:hypothetical protein